MEKVVFARLAPHFFEPSLNNRPATVSKIFFVIFTTELTHSRNAGEDKN